MMDVIEKIEEKLDKLDGEREELEHKLDVKRYQLGKVESMIEKLEDLQEEQADKED